MKCPVIVSVLLLVLAAPMSAQADPTGVLVPEGAPVFGSLSQGASGTLGMPYVGMRIVAPSGFTGAYIEGITGVGDLVAGAAKYELRDDFAGGGVSRLVEVWWNLNGSNSFRTCRFVAIIWKTSVRMSYKLLMLLKLFSSIFQSSRQLLWRWAYLR